MAAFKRSILFFPVRLGDDVPIELPEHFAYTRVRALGDTELAVYYRSDPDYARPFVLYAHGNADVFEFNTVFMEASRAHVNLVAFDYRGYGRSDGVPSERSNDYDLLYLLAWIKHTFPRIDIRRDVVLWGRSIGTHVVLRFISNSDERRQAILPSRVVLFTPFCRLSDVLANMGFAAPFLARLVGNMDVSRSLVEYCRRDSQRRVLVMGTRHDNVTPFESCAELARDVPPEQVVLCEFRGLHSSEFTWWVVLDEFLAHSTTANDATNAEQEVTEDEILSCIARLYEL